MAGCAGARAGRAPFASVGSIARRHVRIDSDEGVHERRLISGGVIDRKAYHRRLANHLGREPLAVAHLGVRSVCQSERRHRDERAGYVWHDLGVQEVRVRVVVVTRIVLGVRTARRIHCWIPGHA